MPRTWSPARSGTISCALGERVSPGGASEELAYRSIACSMSSLMSSVLPVSQHMGPEPGRRAGGRMNPLAGAERLVDVVQQVRLGIVDADADDGLVEHLAQLVADRVVHALQAQLAAPGPAARR